MISEAYTTYYVSQRLEQSGWILDERNPKCNVYQQQSVKQHLSPVSVDRLGGKRPDFTLFYEDRPIAIIEAKKPTTHTLSDAIDQGVSYAKSIGEISMVFACNSNTTKSIHVNSGNPLSLNGIEVTSFLTPQMLRKFDLENSYSISTLPKQVLTDRKELIKVFSRLNDTLRSEGIRAGIERFTEFSNFLFLKLLSEHKEDDLWDKLVRESNDNLISYLKHTVCPHLIDQYGGQVIGDIKVSNPKAIRKIIETLNPLQLTSIDEEIKGLAFEQFIHQTTDTQNDLGEYFTPRHIVRFMVQLLNPKYGETVHDPYCGTGGFLTESFKHISQRCTITHQVSEVLQKHTVFGGEITTTSRIAKMNMILFGDGHSGVIKQDSLDIDVRKKDRERFDNVLTNIPFSQDLDNDVLSTFTTDGLIDPTADEACCESAYERIKPGGKMAMVVPEGLLFNNKTSRYLLRLLKDSKVHLIVRLPSGVFNPYTAAKTAIIFLTEKGTSSTDKFYIARIKNHGFDTRRRPIPGTNDIERVLWWYAENDASHSPLPPDIDVSRISVQIDSKTGRLELHADWKVQNNTKTIILSDIAELINGQSITGDNVIPGPYPVIAGGAGKVPYYHNEFNREGQVITISKSGANAGYVWWHDQPIWSSDSLSIRSLDESKYLTKYIYLCLKQKQDEIYERQQGTGQPHVYAKHLKKFPIPVLSIEDQESLLSKYQETELNHKYALEMFELEENHVLSQISDLYSNNRYQS